MTTIANTSGTNRYTHSLRIADQHCGNRLDQVASLLLPNFSRSRLRDCILIGELLINGQQVKPALRLAGGELLTIDMVIAQVIDDSPEQIALDIVYEDTEILVINKPAGLVVHPAAGHHHGTLLNALLFHDSQLAQLPRAGIVHRLDKDTSGLLVIAKTDIARQSLIGQLQDRSMSRIYFALCRGNIQAPGSINTPIGRHPTRRKKMAVVASGKPAKTFYHPIQQLDGFTLLRVQLSSGRTHQIRVHMHSIGYPLVGDSLYGGGAKKFDPNCVANFPRQALYASKLSLQHPTSQKTCTWQVPMAQDMAEMLLQLENEA